MGSVRDRWRTGGASCAFLVLPATSFRGDDPGRSPGPHSLSPWRNRLSIRRYLRRVGILGAFGWAGALAGCSSATFGSADQEAYLKSAPYYSGDRDWAGSVAYVPITYQVGAMGSPLWDPEGGRGDTVSELVGAMNAYLDSLAAHGLVGPVEAPEGTPPDVYFGCELDLADECLPDDGADQAFGPPEPRMRLAFGRPSRAWTENASSTLVAAESDALLVVTLEVGAYWPRQTNWRGSKAVDLGTDRTEALPWLTGLDTPISVLQLTGSVVDPGGSAVRMGAEGLVACRTPIVASGFGLQALITPEEVRELMTREGAETWRGALRTLVARLVGGPGA